MEIQDEPQAGRFLDDNVLHRVHLCLWMCLAMLSVLLSSVVEAQERDLPRVARTGDAPSMTLAPAQLSPIEADFIHTHPVLRVAVVGVEYAPQQTITNGELGGYSIEFLDAIARVNGFQLEYQVYATLGEVLTALENREADLTPSISINENRKRYLGFTAGITPSPSGLMGLLDDDRFSSNPQLKGMRVAVGRRFVAEAFLTDQFPEAIPVGVESISEALNLLNTGEVDYYYGPLSSVLFAPEQASGDSIEIKQHVFFSSGWMHIAVRSDWPIVTRLFDRFVRDGREAMDEALADVMGDRMQVALPKLNTTPNETRFLRRFTRLRVGTVTGFPLLNSIDDQGKHTGIASEFTAYFAYQIGLSVELVNFESVSQMLDSLANGQIDLIPYFGITEERRKTLRFSDPYLSMPWLAVGRTDSALYWDLGSLNAKTLAMREQHPLRPIIEEHYPKLQLMLTDTAEASFGAVVIGTADAAVESKVYVNRMLSQQSSGTLRVLGEVKDDPGQFAYAVSPDNAQMVPILNKALASMSPGFKDRVIRRWVAVDFMPERRVMVWLKILVPVVAMLGLFLLASLYWNRRTARESGRRLKAEQRLVDMTERLRTGVFQFRQHAGNPPQLEFSNRITREMGRVSEDDLESTTLKFFEYIDVGDREYIQERLTHSLKTGEHFRETFRFELPESEKGWIVCDAHCREESDGARVWSGYLFDMTSERMLTEELNALLADRDEFVSMASHELRTPVQNVAMSLDTIKRESVPVADRQTFDRAKAACRDLEELVDDIVQMSGMNHHSPVLSRDPLNLNEIVSAVCKSFSAPAARKSIDYSVSPDPTLPNPLFGDALRIKQVLYNLIGNAVKYTDHGGISVKVETIGGHQSADERMVSIAVSDTGLGIADDQLARIFEPFATVGPASRRSSGLGLALSDRLVAVMGGQIRVSSTIGEGSIFTVELPLQIADLNEQAQSDESAATLPLEDQPDTLLLVDDNLLVREAVADMLQARGWNVTKADSALKALDFVRRTDFKAVVTDQQMPGMTGIDLAREIRAEQRTDRPRPVLILMSGGMSRESSMRAGALFNAMLFKPVKAEQIRTAVDDVITRWRSDESRAGQPEAVDAL